MMEVKWAECAPHNCDGQTSSPVAHPKFIGLPKVRTKEGLTIVCFLWGEWAGQLGPLYVQRLYNSVQRHLTLPHRFVCFTDKVSAAGRERVNYHPDIIGLIDTGIELKPMDVPDWEWNLRKMLLYKPGNGLTGRVLCFDLDVAITGSLDELARDESEFITCSSPFKRSKGKMGGSLIGFQAGYGEEKLWNPLANADKKGYQYLVRKTRRGSERMYFRMMLKDEPVEFWQDKYPGQVVSYKRECKGGLPLDTRVARFHGRPRPHEVVDKIEWVRENWK